MLGAQYPSKRLKLGAVLACLLLASCNGETAFDSTSLSSAKDSATKSLTPSTTYSVGGMVSGLSPGKSLTLSKDGNTLTLNTNGAFSFSAKLSSGSAYAVTILTLPEGQTCTLSNGSGVIKSAVISDISVTCTALVDSSAKLLFKSNFGAGVSVDAPHGYYTNGHGAWQSIIGTDSETGFTWPIKALGAQFSGIQLITMDVVTPATIGNYITNTIQPVIGPKGTLVNELFQNVKIKGPVGSAGSQAPFIVTRPINIGDVPDLYISYWFKHPADLAAKLDPMVSSGNWRVQFEFKTGGYEDTGNGDYRIATNILKGTDGKLYWLNMGDNKANAPLDPVTYWTVRNFDVPVPVGRWFKFEVFWHRSSGSDGRYWAAVDGQVIVDRFGPNMGEYKLPINRIMINNAYSGGSPTVESHSTGLEIWDGFPCGTGKSCYAPPI